MARLAGNTDHYTIFTSEMEYLYTGISWNAFERLRQHRRSAAWWPMAAWIRVTRYVMRDDALKAEAACIMLDCPPFNKDQAERFAQLAWEDIQAGIYKYPSIEEHEFHVSRLVAFSG